MEFAVGKLKCLALVRFGYNCTTEKSSQVLEKKHSVCTVCSMHGLQCAWSAFWVDREVGGSQYISSKCFPRSLVNAGAHHQKPPLTPYSSHGVFTDRSIFGLNLSRIQIPTGTSDQLQSQA